VIEELARHLGIESRYTDFYGNAHAVPRSSLAALAQAMGYPVQDDDEAGETLMRLRDLQEGLQSVYVTPADFPIIDAPCRQSWSLEREGLIVGSGVGNGSIQFGGKLEPAYYDLTVDGERTTLIAVPRAAYLPPIFENHKAWGVATQLYSLRSGANWGIGDFGDLGRIVRIAQSFGAATVAVNPLHQLHLTNPTSASPYSPNSRLFLNTLYLDVPGVAGSLGLETELRACVDAKTLGRLRRVDLVDYAGVAQLKLRTLRTLYAAFRKRRQSAPHAEFAAFVEDAGPPLRLLAIYEALMKERKAHDPQTYGWLQWPEEFRDPASPAVDDFARTHAEDIEFHEFMQWLADSQLASAVGVPEPMGIGLYRDLAIGVDANSADVWADRAAYCLNVCVGAPPDPLNPRGQNWALPPLDPHVLRARAYAPYIALLRANMRHAGVLRIDHVMGLMRLFCIPAGASAAEGTYLNYRFEEMLGILALESHRNRCMIVGEDLGTVPEGFRSRLSAAHIFGCRLLYFEREPSGEFRAPEAYDRDVVASTGTHDVAPMAGYWAGTDLEVRRQLGFFSDDHPAEAAYQERGIDRRRLTELLLSRGFLGIEEAAGLQSVQGAASEDQVFALVLAAYRLLGRSAARLLLVQLEDAVLQREQVNTPGTFEEVANWRRRLRLPLEEFAASPRTATLFRAVADARSEN
jgi:(1->4)-alpha-D-glucan 1-alpha-D-glucosylmutase